MILDALPKTAFTDLLSACMSGSGIEMVFKDLFHRVLSTSFDMQEQDLGRAEGL